MTKDLAQENLDLLVTNGTVILPSQTLAQANVGIKNKKIVYIGPEAPPTKKTLDAQGLHVLPGVIDSQVHFRDPGMTHKEDFESGTRAAALGGVTSVFDMPNTVPTTTSEKHFNEKIEMAQKKAWVNYAFYVGGSHENIAELAQLERLPGCSGIKVFMGSSTGSLLVEDDASIEKILRNGQRRVTFHSEDEYLLRDRKQLAIQSKDVHAHPIWRDVETALSSTKRLVHLHEKTRRPLHLLHISSQEEIEFLAQAKAQGANISVEVLPQYLTLFAPDCYDRLGNFAQQNPPIRDKRHMEALWKALQSNVIDVIGSDHAPHTRQEKEQPYPQSPSGVPGVQTLVPLMLNHVAQGRLSLERFVEMVCEAPRRIFGCQTKGRIALGMDGDLTIVDLKKKMTISNSWIASKCGWTPYDGMQVTGWPVHTVVLGHVVVQEGQLTSSSPSQTAERVLFS